MSNTILDIAIGLTFVYLLVSLLVSTIQELIASGINMRGKMLQRGLEEMLLESKMLASAILGHPLIGSLQKGARLPSYIPSSTFSIALLDTLWKDGGMGRHVSPTVAVDSLPDSDVKRILSALLLDCENEWGSLQDRVAKWFDDAMDRVTGWYRRTSQYWMLGIAFALAAAGNIDTLSIIHRLWTDEGTRHYLVAQAEKSVSEPSAPAADSAKAIDTIKANVANLEQLRSAQLPIGWPRKKLQESCWLDCSLAFLGWLLTALAASLGAPFWFDTLSKLLKVRGTGVRPEPVPSVPSGEATKGPAKSAAPASSALVSPGRGGTVQVPGPALNSVETELIPHDIAAIQQALKMDSKACTGVLDQATRDKLGQWQKENGLPVTGVLTKDQVKRLLGM